MSLKTSNLNGSNGFLINGISGGDYARVFVASAGDINGDGRDDVMLGAPGVDVFFRTSTCDI
ncbi:MAG: hypothetical protein MRQ09_01410 [Candidatus Midichloria sp.]|nr:hypothetical protein [Candidatus Midichloria sp.]